MFKVVFLISFLILTLNAKEQSNTFNFAVTVHKFDKLQREKIRSAISLVEKEFNKLYKDKYKVKIHFLESDKELIDSYLKNKKFNALVLHTSTYLKYKDRLKEKSKNFFSFNTDSKFQKYILLANKESKINSLKDIKGKKFASYIANYNYSNWLDYLTLKELGLSYKSLIDEEFKYTKDKRLILSLYFGKTDFAIVRENIYEDMLLLNPSIEKRLKVIRESSPMFTYGLGMFNKNLPQKMLEDFNKRIKDGTLNEKFVSLFRIIDQSMIKRVFPSDLEVLESFYDEYKKLKR